MTPSTPTGDDVVRLEGLRVLIVEDEAIVAASLSKGLERRGFEVLDVVDTADDALERVRGLEPDVVLMDIRLRGDTDGIEAAAAIQREFRLPVVYATAYSDRGTLDRALATSPSGYLVKPFRLEELFLTLELAVGRSRELERLRQMGATYAGAVASLADGVVPSDPADATLRFGDGESEVLPALGRLAGGLARELGDVLTTVEAGSKQLLAEPDVVPGTPVARHAERIHDAALRALETTGRVAAFAAAVPALGRVLLIEDEAPLRRLLRVALTQAGFDVLEATDGAAGLALWEARPDAVDLVITDLMMPRMDGRALATTIRRRSPQQRIVAMTGYRHDRDGTHDVVDVVLQKPFRVHDLVALALRLVAEPDGF